MGWMGLDTNQLKAFDQIVRDGSFTKAARALDIAQPTISARIQALEREVGGTLFARTGTILELTQFGRGFLPYARRALDNLLRGIETANEAAAGSRGHLMLATLPTLAGGFFFELLARFRMKYPEVSIAVHTGHNQELLDMLYDGFVKAAFMTWPFYNADVTVLKRFKEPLCFVAHKDHPLSQEDQIDVERLVQTANPFIRVDWSAESKTKQLEMCATQMSLRLRGPTTDGLSLCNEGHGCGLTNRNYGTERR